MKTVSRKKRLGEILVELGLLNHDTLNAVLPKMDHEQQRLGTVLLEQGLITEEQLAQAQVEEAQATLAQAELNLTHTILKAPVRGVVSKKSVNAGQVVQAGQPLLAIVQTDEVWITANFKETQVSDMRPGQRVTIDVDAYTGREFSGHVDSIAAATGARFSLLPPENATGNFVKVVQRIPVKIVLDAGQDSEHLLRPGMSVTPTVFTK